jgi:CBS domain-containing protein
MKVRDVMSKDVQVARPGDTLQAVAGRMSAGDFGFMPVADGDRLIGTITDRDIAVRAVAGGADCSAPVVEFMVRQRVLNQGNPEVASAWMLPEPLAKAQR